MPANRWDLIQRLKGYGAKTSDNICGPLEMCGNLLITVTKLGGEQPGIRIPAGTSCLLLAQNVQDRTVAHPDPDSMDNGVYFPAGRVAKT